MVTQFDARQGCFEAKSSTLLIGKYLSNDLNECLIFCYFTKQNTDGNDTYEQN